MIQTFVWTPRFPETAGQLFATWVHLGFKLLYTTAGLVKVLLLILQINFWFPPFCWYSNALESRLKDVQQKMLLHQDKEVRRSSRLHAQQKEDMSFLEYVNKWKQKWASRC